MESYCMFRVFFFFEHDYFGGWFVFMRVAVTDLRCCWVIGLVSFHSMLVFPWMALQQALGSCCLQMRLLASSEVLSGTRARSSKGPCWGVECQVTAPVRPQGLPGTLLPWPPPGPLPEARKLDLSMFALGPRERSGLLWALIASLLVSPFFCSACLFSFLIHLNKNCYL